jgi:hypothetical protein
MGIPRYIATQLMQIMKSDAMIDQYTYAAADLGSRLFSIMKYKKDVCPRHLTRCAMKYRIKILTAGRLPSYSRHDDSMTRVKTELYLGLTERHSN